MIDTCKGGEGTHMGQGNAWTTGDPGSEAIAVWAISCSAAAPVLGLLDLKACHPPLLVGLVSCVVAVQWCRFLCSNLKNK